STGSRMNPMNALIVVVLASSATAADPQPAAAAPAPIVVYTQSAASEPVQESRPRLFGRVRSYVKGKRTQISDWWNGNSGGEGEFTGPPTTVRVVTPGTVSSPVVMPAVKTSTGSGRVWSGSSAEPPLAEPTPGSPTVVKSPQ